MTGRATMRRVRLLARTSFGRLFENDLFSSSVSASSAVVWLVAAVATPGVMFSGSQYYFYAHARTFAPELQDRIMFVSETFHIAFAMALAGIVTMLVWTSLAPDRRDAFVLGPTPMPLREQAWARLLALLRFFTVIALAVSVPTAVAFIFVTTGSGGVLMVPLRITAHIASTLAAAGFVFFALLGVQMLLAASAGPRAVSLAALPLQAAAVLGMVGALSGSGRLADVLLTDETLVGASLGWNPVAWFVGLYRWVAGDERAVFAGLASRGVFGACSAAALAVVLLPVSYARALRNAVAVEGQRSSRWSGLAARTFLWALQPVLRRPLERGLAAFMVANVTRSHAHRFLVTSYAGMGLLCALPLSGRLFLGTDTAPVHYAWYSIPLGLICWTAAGLRVAMMLPVEPAANWLFKLTEPVDKSRVLSTAVTVMNAVVVVPVAVLFGLGAAASVGATFGGRVLAVVLLLGALLVEALTFTLRNVPATCTYRPGQLRLRMLWPVYLGVWLGVAYWVPALAVSTTRDGTFVAALAAGTVAWLALSTWRSRRARRLASLIYEEADPGGATTVQLGPASA